MPKYTYSPHLARKIFWEDMKHTAKKLIILAIDMGIILGTLFLGSLLDSPEGSGIFSTLIISLFGA